jgi:predicted transcriptional regulator
MGTKAVSVKLSAEEHQRISALAEKRDRSAHYLMREALLEHLEREEWRISFEEEAEAAWVHYMETGEYHTLEDLEEWAKKPDGPLPPCRIKS